MKLATISIYEQLRDTKQPVYQPRIYPSSHDLTYNYNSKRARARPDSCNRDHNEPSTRPSILSKMPPSCNLVYDILRTLAPDNRVVAISQRELAAIIRRSQTQVRRALRRLNKAHVLRFVNHGKGGQKAVYYLRWKSYPQKVEPLTIREDLKDIKPTKERTQLPRESFNRIPRRNPLTEKQKRTGAYLIRLDRRWGLVHGLVDALFWRDCVAGIWQDVLGGLDDLDVGSISDGRARTAVKALVQGKGIVEFRAIMQGEVDIQRRIAGAWRKQNRHPECRPWFGEFRNRLEKGRDLELCAVKSAGLLKTVKTTWEEEQEYEVLRRERSRGRWRDKRTNSRHKKDSRS